MQEKNIEDEFVQKLVDLKYIFRTDITSLDALEKNFRERFDELNQVKLTDKEFGRLLEQIVSRDVFTSAGTLRNRTYFEREDGTPLNFTLVNIKDWCKNTFEAVTQLRINTSSSHHIYDVVLLLNGVPVVQVELKGLQISPYTAIQQIVDYKNDRGNGYGNTLMCFLQMFIVSNRTETWYFANNNNEHFNFGADQRFLPIYQYAERDNTKINELDKFADTFLAKCTLGETISRYMVLVESEQKMLMMRPYQIYAVKSIVDCIQENRGNGYIWHTTGSGKTLTSFKASTLLKNNPDVEKCLFVVDRKDLDRQTREEFNRFQEGCVEENTNTQTLVDRLLSDSYADKVIVTTIQKLGLALDGEHKRDYKARLEPLKNKRVIFIFDECHRSQFGDNHRAIKEFFPNAQLFGFTGTPIFNVNSNHLQVTDEIASYKTTESIFQKSLHEYTITHAIEDRNVLRFHIDYFKLKGRSTTRSDGSIAKRAVVKEILKTHDIATSDRKFNAILATSNINDAIEYHNLFKSMQTKKMVTDKDFRAINIACVFSPPAENNPEIKQLQEDLRQEKQDNAQNPKKKKKALISIIEDYNIQYDTNHNITEFDLYYQDIQKRIKDQQYSSANFPHDREHKIGKIDITIVVDMLLTGFDSKFLNTLYVDKNLKHHGLIQAFSRTNRVLNDSKPYGNIIDFRGQQEDVQEAIKLFSGEGAEDRASEIWLVDKAPVVIQAFDDAKKQLDEFLESQGLEANPNDVPKLKGDAAQCRFINLFKNVQRLKIQLDQYTDLNDKQKEDINTVLPKDELQAYKGVYISTANKLRTVQKEGGENLSPDIDQIDFEFVLFASEIIDHDYIMKLVSEYTRTDSGKIETTRQELVGLIAADAKFDDREDIEAYINELEVGVYRNVDEIRKGLENHKSEKNFAKLNEIAKENGIEKEALQAFVNEIRRRYIFNDADLTDLLKPLDLGWKDRTKKKLALMDALSPLLRKMAEGRDISGLEVYDDA